MHVIPEETVKILFTVQDTCKIRKEIIYLVERIAEVTGATDDNDIWGDIPALSGLDDILREFDEN